MKKILLLSAVLLGAVSVSQAGGVHLSIGLPLPPLPPLPGIHITAPAPVVSAPVYAPPVCAPDYSYSYGPAYYPPAVVVRPPVVSFGFGYPYYGGGSYGGGYYRGGGYHGGGYYHGGGNYHGGYRGGYHGGYHHHGR
jgi:hypothetical protein